MAAQKFAHKYYEITRAASAAVFLAEANKVAAAAPIEPAIAEPAAQNALSDEEQTVAGPLAGPDPPPAEACFFVCS